jgi:hypothetical protein
MFIGLIEINLRQSTPKVISNPGVPSRQQRARFLSLDPPHRIAISGRIIPVTSIVDRPANRVGSVLQCMGDVIVEMRPGSDVLPCSGT